MSVFDLHSARMMHDLHNSGATLEDVARAYASIDGKRDEFDAGNGKSVMGDETGHYAGYICETEEIIDRAIEYARGRK